MKKFIIAALMFMTPVAANASELCPTIGELAFNIMKARQIGMSKSEIILEGKRLDVSFGDTWTCYSNDKSGLADATTPSSSLRLAGFIQAKLQDPIRYIQQEHIDTLYAKHECKKIA